MSGQGKKNKQKKATPPLRPAPKQKALPKRVPRKRAQRPPKNGFIPYTAPSMVTGQAITFHCNTMVQSLGSSFTNGDSAMIFVAPWLNVLGAAYLQAGKPAANNLSAPAQAGHFAPRIRALFTADQQTTTTTSGFGTRFRILKHCISITCTDPLASVGGTIYARRLPKGLQEPNSAARYWDMYNVIVGADEGEAISAGALVNGKCVHCVANSPDALRFVQRSSADFSTDALSLTAWASEVFSTSTDDVPYPYQPTVIFINPTGTGSVSPNYVITYDTVIQIMPTPGPVLEPLSQPLRVGSPNAWLVAQQKMARALFGPVKVNGMSRDKAGYVGA